MTTMEPPHTNTNTSPVKKRQHHQLRALLFNRMGTFNVPLVSGSNSNSNSNTDINDPLSRPSLCSQQYLKGDSVSERDATRTPRGRSGLIRFNSIVSVVAIPTRIQYSTSMRNLLWGKKKTNSRSGSFFFGSDNCDDDNEDLESTAGTQDDPVMPKPVPNPKMAGRHRLVRKKSFHG
jgi:hypothetical protein